MVRENVRRQNGEEEVGKRGHDGGGTREKSNAKVLLSYGTTEEGVTRKCVTPIMTTLSPQEITCRVD